MAISVFDIATDLNKIRIEQARLLKERARGSAFSLEMFVGLFALLIGLTVSPIHGALWFTAATTMVLVTLLYAKFMSPEGITEDTVEHYLTGHTIICAFTGLVWGGSAIYFMDFTSPVTFFVSGSMPMILTVGGMLPSSAYRRGYIALATCALIPFALYLVIAAPGEVRFYGVGALAYFALCMTSSAQAEINTRDGIIARTTKSLTEQLMRKNIEIQNAHDAKTQFLVATSHDFSQPLHAQGYFIQALRREISTSAQSDLLDKIEVSWKAQSELLQGLAKITRLESGAAKPNFISYDLKVGLDNIASEFQANANSKSIALLSEIEDICVYTDPLLLSRIIRNLLENALKFSPSGSEVNFRSFAESGHAIISITDNGPGIPQTEQAHVFDEYVQLGVDNSTAGKGSGLGLSIVKRLCNLLDIDLELTSQSNEGTQFILKLPLSQGSVKPNKDHTDIAAHFTNNPLVILVDDEDYIRSGMTVMLTGWGLQVISAADGTEAINLLSETQETPALLIIDKRLKQGEGGIDLIHTLREEVNEDTPAILMTGDLTGFRNITKDEDIQVLFKPTSPQDMKSAIWKILSE